jgi:hypothetical protein
MVEMVFDSPVELSALEVVTSVKDEVAEVEVTVVCVGVDTEVEEATAVESETPAIEVVETEAEVDVPETAEVSVAEFTCIVQVLTSCTTGCPLLSVTGVSTMVHVSVTGPWSLSKS